MKKIIKYLSVALIFIVVMVVSLLLIFQKNNIGKKVMICNWYDFEEKEVLTLPTNDITSSTLNPYYFSVSADIEEDKFINTIKQSDKFIEEKKVKIGTNLELDSYILLGNNNYYVAYYIQGEGCIMNLLGDIEYGQLSFVIPIQYSIYYNPIHCPSTKDEFKNYFEGTSYTESKEFYLRLDSNYINADDDNQTIIISSLDMFKKQRYDVYLNYQEKTVKVLKNGEFITIHE